MITTLTRIHSISSVLLLSNCFTKRGVNKRRLRCASVDRIINKVSCEIASTNYINYHCTFELNTYCSCNKLGPHNQSKTGR